MSSTVISRWCVSLPRLHYDHALTLVQANILIDSDGHARVGGLGAAYISSFVAGVDVDGFFEAHGSAPELVYSRSLGSKSVRATKESDMHALGVLAYEVSLTAIASYEQMIRSVPSLRCLLVKPQFSKRVSSYRPVLNTLSFPTVCGR